MAEGPYSKGVKNFKMQTAEYHKFRTFLSVGLRNCLVHISVKPACPVFTHDSKTNQHKEGGKVRDRLRHWPEK